MEDLRETRERENEDQTVVGEFEKEVSIIALRAVTVSCSVDFNVN